MDDNFHEGFIFVSQESFVKIKTTKCSLSTCKASQARLYTSNFLAVRVNDDDE